MDIHVKLRPCTCITNATNLQNAKVTMLYVLLYEQLHVHISLILQQISSNHALSRGVTVVDGKNVMCACAQQWRDQVEPR